MLTAARHKYSHAACFVSVLFFLFGNPFLTRSLTPAEDTSGITFPEGFFHIQGK